MTGMTTPRRRVPPPRSLRGLAVILAAALLALPAAAQEIVEDEALVMRLIFEDCLGFARNERTPFGDLETFPVTDPDLGPPAQIRPWVTTVHLMSERYVAFWGDDPSGRRLCFLQTDIEAEEPMLLGVRPEGFTARITARAAEEGMTEALTEEEFTPLRIDSWSEPGEDPGELSMTVAPTGANADGTVLDAGLFAVSGGGTRSCPSMRCNFGCGPGPSDQAAAGVIWSVEPSSS